MIIVTLMRNSYGGHCKGQIVAIKRSFGMQCVRSSRRQRRTSIKIYANYALGKILKCGIPYHGASTPRHDKKIINNSHRIKDAHLNTKSLIISDAP